MANLSSSGPPPKAARLSSLTSQEKPRRVRPFSPGGGAPRLHVFARLPASCPFVGSFHYAPSAGNRAYSFFEGQIVPHRETGRLHKIKTNPLTGNFHSRPGHYSRLHGLQKFRSESEMASAAKEGGMEVIIARIKTSLTEPTSSAVAEATAKDVSIHERALCAPPPAKDCARVHVRPAARRVGYHKTHSACDALSATMPQPSGKPKKPRGGGVYSKYWEAADTERGRFGNSVDDNALAASSQQHQTAEAAAADGYMVEAAVAAGVRGLGKGGIHWGKHHHHHHHSPGSESPGSDEGEGVREPLIGDATAKLRHIYFRQKRASMSSAVAAAQRARINVTVAARSGSARGMSARDAPRGNSAKGGKATVQQSRRGFPDAWAAAAAADASGGMGGGMPAVVVPGKVRRGAFSGQGWESHTVKAQQTTEEYMQGREDLAPDMRPDVVLENEVSLAYDVDVSDSGILGAGAYGTVLAAVHRSTGRQVAIKTMLKKYLFSDAEKASVEREIEIQQRLVNNHVIRLYEIYQSPEKLYLVVERAPCGSLEEFLYLRGRMNELDAKRVVRQLLDGLAYLHKVGVVHCDLKPANILFSDIDQGGEASTADDASGGDGGGHPVAPRPRSTEPPTSVSGLVVKICDFGHTRKVPDCRYYKFTGDINKIPFHMFRHTGTEGFVAPEILLQEPYGKAADMWSTGCMLYQMLTGRMPWIPSRACLQRPLSTSGPVWKGISEQAKSLVGLLLTPDQALRADVDQATHHPWFEGIHHCARMPTSAPGGKTSMPTPPRRGLQGSLPVPPMMLPPARDPGSSDSADVAGGGRGRRTGKGSPSSEDKLGGQLAVNRAQLADVERALTRLEKGITAVAVAETSAA